MIDVETRATQAGHDLRARAADRLAPLPADAIEPSRRWGLTTVAAVAAVLVGVVVLTDVPISRVPTIEQVTGPGDVADPVAVDGELPVPPVGEALPAYLADGSPVFVSQPAEGEVLVLDAITPHVEEELNWFCRSAGLFYEPSHSSQFTAWGDYHGGPAPTALASAPSVRVGEDRLRIVGPLGAAPERDERRFEAGAQRGPGCGDLNAPVPRSIVAHRPPDRLPHLDGTAVPADRWVWTQLTLAERDGELRVCRRDGRCGDDSPLVRWGDVGWRPPADQPAWLARRGPDGTVRLLAPAHPDDRLPR